MRRWRPKRWLWASNWQAIPRLACAISSNAFYTAAEADFETELNLEEELDSICYASPETRERLAAFLASRKKSKPDG